MSANLDEYGDSMVFVVDRAIVSRYIDASTPWIRIIYRMIAKDGVERI